jgi:hypothetical protein
VFADPCPDSEGANTSFDFQGHVPRFKGLKCKIRCSAPWSGDVTPEVKRFVCPLAIRARENLAVLAEQLRELPCFHMKRLSIWKFPGHEVYYTTSSWLGILKTSCSKLHCQVTCRLKVFSHPHGGVRPFHQKSTCLTQLTLGRYVVQSRPNWPVNRGSTKPSNFTVWKVGGGGQTSSCSSKSEWFL